MRNDLMCHDETLMQITRSGKQYQQHENILKVETFSREINKLMRYSIKIW